MTDVLTRLEAAIRDDRLLAFVSDLEGQVHEARAEAEAAEWEQQKLAEGLKAAKELLALYHPVHEYPEHHLCPGCVFLGR